MTEDQMNKLADIIVEKLVAKQAEYDAEFLKAMKAQANDPDMEITFYSTNTLNPNEMTKEEIIADLKKSLQKALDEEDYMKAVEITEQIKKLQT